MYDKIYKALAKSPTGRASSKALINLLHKYDLCQEECCMIGPYVKDRQSGGHFKRDPNPKGHVTCSLPIPDQGPRSVYLESQSRALPSPQNTTSRSEQDCQGWLSCPFSLLLLTPPGLRPGVGWVGNRSSKKGNKEVNLSPPPTVGFSTWNSTKRGKKSGLIFTKSWASHFYYCN